MKISFRQGLAVIALVSLLTSQADAQEKYSFENDRAQCQSLISGSEYESSHARVFNEISNLLRMYPDKDSFNVKRVNSMYEISVQAGSPGMGASWQDIEKYSASDILKLMARQYSVWADKWIKDGNDKRMMSGYPNTAYYCMILPWRNVLIHLSRVGGSSAGSTNQNNRRSNESQQQTQPTADRARADQQSNQTSNRVEYHGPTPNNPSDCSKSEVIRSGAFASCMMAYAAGQNKNRVATAAPQNPPSQQPQSVEVAVQQAQGYARDAQSRGDASAQRAGRRTHDPAAEAHECVQLDNPASAYPVNNCAFKINVAMCVTDPRSTNNFFNANDSFQCQNLKTGGGLWSPEAGRPIQGIVPKSAGMIYWFACKAPSNPSDTEFTGSAISARCN